MEGITWLTIKKRIQIRRGKLKNSIIFTILYVFFHQLLRFDTMKNSQKLRKSQLDGLNTVQYDLLKIEKNNLFVRFYISYNKTLTTTTVNSTQVKAI